MEVHRSAKHRSLGVDIKNQPAPPKRPSMGERHRSAPSVSRIRQVQTQQDSSKPRPQGSEQDTSGSGAGVRDSCPIINLVVLGNSRVGKTLFIQNALDLQQPTSNIKTSSKVSLSGVLYRAQLFELNLDDVEIVNGRKLNWPTAVRDVASSSINGVLCLYDVTDEDSIVGVPQVLHVLDNIGLPTVLVACKADARISEQEVGITFIEKVQRSFPAVQFCESSSLSTISAKKSLAIALKAASANIPRSTVPQEDRRENVRRSKPTALRLNTSSFEQTPAAQTAPHTPSSDTGAVLGQERSKAVRMRTTAPETPDSHYHSNMLQSSARELGSDAHESKTFLQIEDDSDEALEQSLMHLTRLDLVDSLPDAAADGGTEFTDLVDRLLQLPNSKNEAKFVPAFLCLYRAFATPRDLLVSIIDRFMLTDQSELVQFTKLAELLRYLQVVAQWTANYPGDFADPVVRELATTFVCDLEKSKVFAPAAREIHSNLQTVTSDEDRDWAYEQLDEQSLQNQRRPSTTPSSKGGKFQNQGIDSDYSDGEAHGQSYSPRHSGSGSTASSMIKSTAASSQSASNLFTLENAREQAKRLRSIPHIRITKVQWHQFMEIPTEELAREITRVDWTMYSAIRPRDFVRHVSLSSQKRASTRHTDTIGLMVRHFNHLALFVSAMILLRDKPKHRAKMLEKFMDLAWKVRQLNNYNSLGAIVAGVTGPEISRLAQTHEMIAPETQKQFLRLTILMSISRSHSAYRMAWENSFNERIPFIPLVRQDLTMAAGANQTFIGKNINWKKFEIMGDVIIGVQRSHEQPYSFPEKTQRSQEITRLILETKVIDESEDSADPRSELYDRSVQLEPQATGDGRKKFDWPWR